MLLEHSIYMYGISGVGLGIGLGVGLGMLTVIVVILGGVIMAFVCHRVRSNSER